MFNEAAQLLGRGEYPRAIEILERAHRLDPDNYKIPLDIGFAQALSYDFAAATRWFDKTIQLAAGDIEALLAIADHWQEVRNFDASLRALELVMAQKQKDVPLVALMRLADIYVRQRQLDKACEIAERAMQMHGTHEGAMLTRAKVHREMKQLEEAEKLLRAVLSKPGCEVEARALAFFELGIVLDRQERYDEAMGAFLDAKALTRMNAEGAAKVLRMKQNTLKQLTENMTPAIVQRWRKFGENELQPRRKVALLCGHARSGTTLLEYILDAHPQIISADESSVFQSKAYQVITRSGAAKESLISTLDWISARNLRQIRTDYFRGIESVIGQAVGDRWLLDKNPAMTFDIPTICRFLPETRFLVAMRDPRDVCLSCFMQTAPILPDTVPWLTLESTIDNYIAITNLWQALKPCVGDAAVEVRYEDLVANLEGVARRVLVDFMGLAWDGRVLSFNEHAQSKTIASPTFAEVTKPIYKTAIGRWRNYQKYFEPHLEKLAPTLRALGYE